MDFRCIEEEIKKDKLRDFSTKLKIVRNIIEKCEDEYAKERSGKKDVTNEHESIDKRVRFMCQVDIYFIYQAIKIAGNQNWKMSLQRWLTEMSQLENNSYEKYAKILREPYVQGYVIQRTIPSEDIIRRYLRSKTNYRAVSWIGCLKINGYTLRWLPKTKKGIIIEKPQQLNERLLYLKKITQYREEGRKIIYLEERITLKRLVLNDKYKFQNACTHTIILCNEDGVIMNFGMVCRFYHESAATYFLNFIESNIDRLPPNCVVVLGDKGHHKQDVPPLPTKFSSKKQMTDWLAYNEVDHNPDMHRAELCKLIDAHKRDNKVRYNVEDFLKCHGHSVVRRPFHCQYLNHFNDFWKEVNDFVQNKEAKLQLSYIIKESMKEAGEIFTPAIWKAKEREMIEEERRILREDLQVEEIIDRLCTMMKYGDESDNQDDLIDSDCPAMEIDYNFSKQVASVFDETDKYLIRPNY